MKLSNFLNFIYQDSNITHSTVLIGIGRVIMMFMKCRAGFVLPMLRLCQYFSQKPRGGGKVMYYLAVKRYGRLCDLYNVEMPVSVTLGRGCSFPHKFPLVINSQAEIGENCIIHPCVVIGRDRSKEGAPKIGKNCFIGHGAKIIGNPVIGDFCFITPGAFISKDIQSYSVVGVGVNNVLSDKGESMVRLYSSSIA